MECDIMEQRWTHKVLRVSGMTCSGCEMTIENKLKKLKGISEVKAQYGSSSVKVTYDADVINLNTIVETIEKLDYKVESTSLVNTAAGGDWKKTPDRNTEKKMTINQVLGIGIVLFALYMIIQHTVGFNFIPQVDESMGYGILFVVGLVTSLHCVAMCGGINLSQCMSYKPAEGDANKVAKLKPSLLYNTGRVVSYTIIGGIAGVLGGAVSFSGAAKGVVAILSGLFMIIMGLNMLNLFPWLRKLNPRMPKFFAKKVHGNKGKYGPFIVGLLNGLMPCGPLQAMQIYALGTGSFVAGAFSMFMFSLGTVPLMFGLGALSTLLSTKFTHRMMKVGSLLVLVLGFIMVGRGLSLSGVNISFAMPIGSSTENVAKVEGDVQLITTTLESGRYTPIVVKKGIPVKWTIKVAEGDLNGCNNPVTIPKYNLQKELAVGDNVIEFIPEEEGTIPYSCWMGMIRSYIKVVGDVKEISANDQVINSDQEIIGQSDQDDQAYIDTQSGALDLTAGGCCAAGAKATKFADGKVPTDEIAVATIKDDQQEVTVTVNDYGYFPAVVVVQRGVPTKIKFNAEQLNSCNNVVVFPEYQGQLDLEKQTETPWLTPDGDFTFQCWMGMLHGYVKVVDDINQVDLDAIKDEVANFTPSSAGVDSCCK